jgi:uncharacterized protein (TIGR03084 family)
MTTTFDDLEAEGDRLEAVLTSLDAGAWQHPSAAAGWTVADVVLHLAQTEEVVVGSAESGAFMLRPGGRGSVASVDEWAEAAVRAERAEAGVAVFERWKTARHAALSRLRSTAPGETIPWVVVPLKPATLATTRLAEHWAHALDIASPLGVPLPDTDRLRHIAWLGHRTLPYGLSLLGLQDHEVFCDLVGPSGDRWQFGPLSAASVISGPAGDFCRVGARRLAPEESELVVSGPHGADALRALRNYAA